MKRYRLRRLAIFAAVISAAMAAISGVAASPALAAGACVADGTGYFADSCWVSTVPLTGMTVGIEVPPDPTSTGESDFSIWGGLDDNNSGTVLQNVLNWNGSSWSFFPEYYIGDGRDFQYQAIPVYPGNTLYSKITSIDCSSTGQCIWTLNTEDASTGQGFTTQPIGSTNTFQTALGGVLEVHSGHGCLSLPSSGHIAFRDIAVENLNFQYPTPDFGAGTPDRQCSMTASATPTSTDFLWTP